ncbi:MAG: MBL fold metallo-hydrolase [Deltaproteobacteria bacterium]|nr:MBL fold metallo-hydrolase [Deltaproteobacteria bacterium]
MELQIPKQGYDRPVEIAERIYWVGFHDEETNFHCNPYLIVEDGRAAVIDAGSRPDFPVVMLKIMQTGISPEQIAALIYQHPDPDLCGSMSNMVDLCASPDLEILSDPTNNIFLSYYLEREKRRLLRSVDEYGLTFSVNGRVLQFFKTPFAHSAGSFVTYDPRTKTLFTSDLFGSLSQEWDLFLKLDAECRRCSDTRRCQSRRPHCPLSDIMEFHKRVMPSEKSLQWAMNVISGLDVQLIAPQHGSIVNRKEDIDLLADRLANLKGVGIDGF